MMAYFRFQFHQLLTNRKNLAVIGIALVALICQFVFFPPNTTPVELPTATVLSRDRDKNIAFVNESHGPNTAVWVPSTREFAKLETQMLTAQKQGKIKLTFAQLSTISAFCEDMLQIPMPKAVRSITRSPIITKIANIPMLMLLTLTLF